MKVPKISAIYSILVTLNEPSIDMDNVYRLNIYALLRYKIYTVYVLWEVYSP